MTTVHQLRRAAATSAGVSARSEARRTSERVISLAAWVFTAAAVATPIALVVAMEVSTYDIWAAFWVAPILMLLTVPLATRAARREQDPGLGRVLMVAVFLKVVIGSSVRYLTIYRLYDGSGDAERYHDAAVALAPTFRRGDFTDLGQISGTRFVEVASGIVYSVVGETRLGAFMVFSWFGFVGLFFFYRALRIALPHADHRRYRLLLFFFPTLWFWPSSIGKESLMLFFLGLATYGIVRMLSGGFAGIFPAAIGLWGATVVRPHITLIILIAGTAAAAVRSARPSAGDEGRRWVSALTVGFIALVSVVAVGQAEEFLGLDELNIETAEETLEERGANTQQGGSEFTTSAVRDPISYGRAVVTVVLRPFPIEANSAQSLLSSAEGVLLMVVAYISLNRLARLPPLLLRSPYVMFAVVYVSTFVYAFSRIENFGILARQRAQLFPVLLVLFVLPIAADKRAQDAAPDELPAAP